MADEVEGMLVVPLVVDVIADIVQKRRVREVNLLEENVSEADQDLLQVAPFEIKTVKLPSR